MGYPDGYQPAEHRRALDALLADMFDEADRPRSPLRTVRAAGRASVREGCPRAPRKPAVFSMRPEGEAAAPRLKLV